VSDDSPSPDLPPSPKIDTTVSHSARIWDYWLKGKDNYKVDREVGDRTHRTPDQIARFFDGLELVEPGVVSITRWRPEATSSGEPDEIDQFGAVGRKP